MSTTNLFGQYYNKTLKKTTYQNVDYTCQSSSNGEYTLIFDDGQVKVIDNNGNVIANLDLGDVAAHPITEYTKGSIVINPGEVKLLEGIEYGKIYKETYFHIPYIYISSLGDKYKYYFNVKFNILFNVDLDLREYEICTVLSPEDEKGDILSRIQKLLDEIGLEGKVQVTIEEIEDSTGTLLTFLCFRSLILGYDFIITDFTFFNPTILQSDVIDEFEVSSATIEEILESEDNIAFRGGSTYNKNRVGSYSADGNIGRYDELNQPYNESQATQYYETTEVPEGYEPIDEPDDEPDDDPIEDGSGSDNNEDSSGEEGTLDNIVLHAMSILSHKDERLEIPAFLYPNGAARAWFIVPVWPEGIQDDIHSIKLNHVRDYVTIFDQNFTEECGECYIRKDVDVYAAERNEVERHNLQKFKYWSGENYTYIDGENGTAREIIHENEPCDCPNINLEIMNPHIGMYRYLDYVEMNNAWTNVGQFYGLVTAADTTQSLIKNLANSIFLYNENTFPIKVNYLICN